MAVEIEPKSKIRQSYETTMTRGRKQHQRTTIKLGNVVRAQYGKAMMMAARAGVSPTEDPVTMALADVLRFIASDDWLWIGDDASDDAEKWEDRRLDHQFRKLQEELPEDAVAS